MKTNKLFFAIAALAAMTFGSCAKDDAGQTDNNDGKTPVVNLRLAFDSKSGRAIESEHAHNSIPTVTKLVVEALNSSNAVVNTFTFIGADITTLQSATGLDITVSNAAVSFKIYGNPTTATDINAMQGYDIVHLEGTGNIDKTGTAGTKASPHKATVTITPKMARIEVKGAIQPVWDANNNRYYAVDVEEIFVNYIQSPVGTIVKTGEDTSSGWGTWYGLYSTTGTKSNLFDQLVAGPLTAKSAPVAGKGEFYTGTPADRNIGVAKTKAAGFNLFPQTTTETTKETIAEAMPHIILRVKIYASAADYAAGTFIQDRQFITIRTFTKEVAGNPEYVKEMNEANIYTIDLNDLSGYFTDKEDPADPNPESGKMHVNVKVTVTNWTVTAIKPEL